MWCTPAGLLQKFHFLFEVFLNKKLCTVCICETDFSATMPKSGMLLPDVGGSLFAHMYIHVHMYDAATTGRFWFCSSWEPRSVQILTLQCVQLSLHFHSFFSLTRKLELKVWCYRVERPTLITWNDWTHFKAVLVPKSPISLKHIAVENRVSACSTLDHFEWLANGRCCRRLLWKSRVQESPQMWGTLARARQRSLNERGWKKPDVIKAEMSRNRSDS